MLRDLYATFTKFCGKDMDLSKDLGRLEHMVDNHGRQNFSTGKQYGRFI